VSDPRVVDIRSGLTEEVLDGLRRADRVVLAVKTSQTAALGYWVGDELTIAVLASAFSQVMLLPHQMIEGFGAPAVSTLKQPARQRGVLLDVPHAAEDDFWGRVLGVLRPGDVVMVTHDTAAPRRAAVQVSSHGQRVVSLTLPKRSPAQHESAA
jgi:hypothetical protein